MTTRDFAFWLQGFFEVTNPEAISKEQTLMIKKHLNLVFVHDIDPSMGDAEHQEKLNTIHNLKIPTTEAEAIAAFGPKPSPVHEFNLHGWYNLAEGVPRC